MYEISITPRWRQAQRTILANTWRYGSLGESVEVLYLSPILSPVNLFYLLVDSYPLEYVGDQESK